MRERGSYIKREMGWKRMDEICIDNIMLEGQEGMKDTSEGKQMIGMEK